MADQAAFRAVEQVLTGAVSKVLSKFQPQGATAKSSRGKRRKGPTLERAATPNSSSSEDDFQHLVPARKRTKSSTKTPRTYPSTFLNNREQQQQQSKRLVASKKGKGKLLTYERDIICLPRSFACQGNLINVPRKKSVRLALAINKLVGKIQLNSSMDEEDIYQEIRSVFRAPMNYNDHFEFKVLQTSGGDSRSLVVPQLSSSYRWTAGAICGRNARTPIIIYILAVDQLLLTEPFSGDEADQEADQESTGCSDYDLPNVKIGSGKQKNIMTKDNFNKAGPGFQSNVTNDDLVPGTSNPWMNSTYIDFVNLVSDEDEQSPTPPPFSPLTPVDECDGMSIEALLSRQRGKFLPVDRSVYQRIVVRRKHLWQDSLHRFQCGLDFCKHIRVLFVGEPAVDDGGPLREFLYLLMGEISANNSLFCGQENIRIPAANMAAFEKHTYKHVGQMIAVSLLHGGPAPTFFAPSIVDYIIHGITRVKLSIDEVPNPIIKSKLFKLSSTNNEESLRKLLDSDEYAFRFEIGVCDVSSEVKLSDRDRIVLSLANYFTVVVVKAYIDQIVDGLKVLGISELIKANPRTMHKLFVTQPVSLTSDYMLNLFTTRFSPEGANRQEDEEQIVTYWVNFIERIEAENGKLYLTNTSGEVELFILDYKTVLAFCTGASFPPPMVFVKPPTLAFQDVGSYPRSNTCANTPAKKPLPSSEQFEYYMAFGILNAAGFGHV